VDYEGSAERRRGSGTGLLRKVVGARVARKPDSARPTGPLYCGFGDSSGKWPHLSMFIDLARRLSRLEYLLSLPKRAHMEVYVNSGREAGEST
jgi:hypothetical protein